jgi:hypothetical protein
MKKELRFLVILLLISNISSYSFAQTKKDAKTSGVKLEIMYFHATKRCVTCNAVENHAKALLQEQYKSKFDKGEITFKSYNFEEKANSKLVNKHKIGFSTLLLVKQNGKKVDFTNTAFQYAKNNPEQYKKLLKAEIDKLLK